VDEAAPTVVYLTPPVLPPNHKLDVPSLVALRGLPPLAKSGRAVEVSTEPEVVIVPTTRLIVAPVLVVMFAVPTVALYPASVMRVPSLDRVNSPSEVDVPEPVRILLDPLTAVGMAMP